MIYLKYHYYYTIHHSHNNYTLILFQILTWNNKLLSLSTKQPKSLIIYIYINI
jgi:hypothetical protein